MQPAPVLIADRSGRIDGVSKRATWQYPFFLLTNPNDNSTPMAANSISAPVIMSISYRGPALISWLGHQKTGNCLVNLMIQDGSTPKSLMNNPCHANTILGNNGQPYYLPEDLYVDENRQVVARFVNATAVANAIRLCGGTGRFTHPSLDPLRAAQKLRNQENQYLTYPYFYTLIPTNTAGAPIGALRLAGLGTSTQVIDISTNHDFRLVQISRFATGNFTINISEAATGESLLSAPGQVNFAVDARLISGTNNFPFKLPFPRMLKRGTKLIVTLTDTSGAQNDIYLTLAGQAIANAIKR